MASVKFRYSRTESGWQMKVADSSLEGPLEGVFRYELRAEELPVDIPVVGHCRVLGLWCVFVSEGGHAEFEGAILRSDEYEDYGFDPFVVGARVLGSVTLSELVEGDVIPRAAGSISQPISVTGRHDYLTLAYGYFVAGDLEARQSLYCSVLPEGCPKRISPLTCFVTRGNSVTPHGVVEPVNSDEPVASDEPTPPPEHDESPPPAADEAPEPPPVPEEPPEPFPATAEEPESLNLVDEPMTPEDVQQSAPPDGQWFEQPLSRTGAVQTASPEPSPEPESPPTPELVDTDDPHSLGARLERTERRLRVRTWWLGAGLLLAVLGAAIAYVLGSAQINDRIAQLEASKVDLETLSTGLGLTAEGRTIEDALQAKLRDLATASIQSGAWQEGLKSRGVTAEQFLDRLVVLSSRHDSLRVLAGSRTELVQLARQATALEDLISQHQALIELSARVTALTSLADRVTPLQELAASKPDIEAVIDNRDALVALAGQQQQLEQLLSYASTLRSTAREVANVTTFMERWRDDLEQLASREQQLSDIASNKQEIDRLLRVNTALLDLVANKDALDSLVDNLANLVALSSRSSELLALAEGSGATVQ